MIPDTNSRKKNPVAFLAAYFTIGLVETLFPRLNWQINFIFLDEHYLRVLTFIGLLILAFLSVLFSLMKPGKDGRHNLIIALLVTMPGLLIPFISIKSVNLVLLSDMFLFSGSLFVQVAGLQFIFSPYEKGKNSVRIALLYLFKSAGLITGMSIPGILSGTKMEGSSLLLYVSIFFLLFSLAFLLLFPFPANAGTTSEKQMKFSVRHLISDKSVLMVLGGLIVYSGAEYCLVDLIPLYFSETFGIKIMQTLIPGVGLFMFSFVIGRLAGIFILGKNKPEIVFLMSSVLCILGLFTIFIGQKYLSLAASVMIGLGSSNIFPIMLSMSLNRLKEERTVLIGLMIGTIPIGALFPSLMWAVADSVSIAMSFTVPVFCMFYITWIAIMLVRRRGL
ncbi:MAG: MFS transporter [Bacteroidetes bacterium]|nr:MFS transporter [Bacteroidota bacterium]